MSPHTWSFGERFGVKRLDRARVEITAHPRWNWQRAQVHLIKRTADGWFWEASGRPLLVAPEFVWFALNNALDANPMTDATSSTLQPRNS